MREQPTQRIVIEQPAPRRVGGWLLPFLLLVIVGIAAAVTKPDEMAIKKALVDKHGVFFGLGAGLGEAMGTAKYTYHDYLVFSTMTVEGIAGPKRTIAYGVFGQVNVTGP